MSPAHLATNYLYLSTYLYEILIFSVCKVVSHLLFIISFNRNMPHLKDELDFKRREESHQQETNEQKQQGGKRSIRKLIMEINLRRYI